MLIEGRILVANFFLPPISIPFVLPALFDALIIAMPHLVHNKPRHRCRRTFIVNTLSLGITPYIMMKLTGHLDNKAMKHYIDNVASIKASAMTKLMDCFNLIKAQS